MVYFSRESRSQGQEDQGGRLNFLNFENDRIEQCFELLRKLQKRSEATARPPHRRSICVMATGGGAYKYYDRMKDMLGVEVIREDEMECLIMGEDTRTVIAFARCSAIVC